MSRSERSSRLTVQHASPTLEIELLDSNFATVANGVGALDVPLAPGVYEIRFREGPEHDEQLLKVEADPLVVEAPRFAPASPAPVDMTSTSHEYHQQPVLEANAAIRRDCAAPGPQTGGVVVMVRNVGGQEQLPFPANVDKRITITDEKLARLDGDSRQWQLQADAGWALWSAAVTPGGYTLRLDSPDEPALLHQALWVEAGWQTMVFIPNTPEGPAPELATIHIVRVGEWSPWDEASASAVALESVLAGLRDGRPVVPSDLDELFRAKFVNPFLGIAAAHALLLEPKPSHRLFEMVIANLKRLLPTCPDVAALAYRGRSLGTKLEHFAGVTWPPTFYLGYRALLRADATSPGVLVDGSPAEVIAARLRVAGLFTTWAEPRPVSASRTAARGIGEAIGLIDAPADPATERVRSYVESAARVENTSPEKILGKRSVKQLALATGLPTASVRGALKRLDEGDG